MLPDQPRTEQFDRLLNKQTGRSTVPLRLVTQNFEQPRRRRIGESHARKNLDTSSTRNLVGARLETFLSEVDVRNDHGAGDVPVAVNAFRNESEGFRVGPGSQALALNPPRYLVLSFVAADGDVPSHAAHVVLLQAAMRPLACQPRITMQNFRHQYRWLVQDARHLDGSI